MGAGSSRRLDHLNERPSEETEIVVLTGPLGSGEGVLVSTEAVVQHCRRILGQTDRPSLAPGGCVADVSIDDARRLGLLTTPASDQRRCVRKGHIAGCLADRIRLFDQRRCRRELTDVDMNARALAEGNRQGGQRAGFASEHDRASCQSMPSVVVPKVGCDGLGDVPSSG